MSYVLSTYKLTMTSREIAELTGKRHDHVLRDIDLLVKELRPDLGLGFKSSTYKDSTGKTNRIYDMDKDSTYCLISGYDANGRMRIIKRWRQLEERAADRINKKQQRQIGKDARASFIGTLREHGVAGFGFAQCTNGIYQPLLGATAIQLKQQKGFAKASLRDTMSYKELLAISFAEMVAAENIESKELQGNSPCYHACKEASEKVRELMVRCGHTTIGYYMQAYQCTVGPGGGNE